MTCLSGFLLPQAARLVAMTIALIVATSACASQGDAEVLGSFLERVERKTLPAEAYADRVSRETLAKGKQLAASWRLAVLARGSVSYVKDKDIYEISVPALDRSEYRETWGFNDKTGDVWPVDSGALISALFLFCPHIEDIEPTDLECSAYLTLLSRIEEALREK